jgi:pyruvate,water dikinase
MREPSTNGDVVWLDDISVDDVAQAGGKGANLGELIGAGHHVPGGFVVTADAYRSRPRRRGV